MSKKMIKIYCNRKDESSLVSKISNVGKKSFIYNNFARIKKN